MIELGENEDSVEIKYYLEKPYYYDETKMNPTVLNATAIYELDNKLYEQRKSRGFTRTEHDKEFWLSRLETGERDYNGLYQHYAIYIGNDRVIHYCGETKDFDGRVTVHEAPLSDFLKGSKNYFVVWFDDGSPIKIQASTSFVFPDYYDRDFQMRERQVHSSQETIRRAKSRLGEADYNLVSNNCEHFAMWCKTGVAESSQVRQVVKYAVQR